eukprot:1457260-Amphidinium_carterae.1
MSICGCNITFTERGLSVFAYGFFDRRPKRRAERMNGPTQPKSRRMPNCATESSGEGLPILVSGVCCTLDVYGEQMCYILMVWGPSTIPHQEFIELRERRI